MRLYLRTHGFRTYAARYAGRWYSLNMTFVSSASARSGMESTYDTINPTGGPTSTYRVSAMPVHTKSWCSFTSCIRKHHLSSVNRCPSPVCRTAGCPSLWASWRSACSSTPRRPPRPLRRSGPPAGRIRSASNVCTWCVDRWRT